MVKKEVYDTVIVGAGMAGLTAAIYAARKKMKFEIISEDFGGNFNISREVLNYPGIVKTTGSELDSLMKKQMDFNGIKVKIEKVKEVKKKGKDFLVRTEKNDYLTKTLILATGSMPRKLGVPGEKEFAGRGVTYCSVCDGPLFSGKEVAVVGGGDSALDAVDFMKDIASKIYVLMDEEKFSANESLQAKVKKNPKVEVFFGVKILSIFGGAFVSGLKMKYQGKDKELNVQGVIIEAGRMPSTENFKKLVKLDEHKHILIDCWGQTKTPGVFAAGDCASGHEYQYVIAAGQGAMALLKAARYLARKK